MAMPGTHSTVLPTHGWSATSLAALPAPDDGTRRECVAGELLVTPAPDAPHQAILAELFHHLDAYVRQHRAGWVRWSPADITLDERTLVQPDLFVLPRSLPPAAPWSDVRELLLVVEVLSPSSARADRVLKRRAYQRAGVPTYWIVDPDARLVEEWRPESVMPMISDAVIERWPSGAVEPLRLELPHLFRDALESD